MGCTVAKTTDATGPTLADDLESGSSGAYAHLRDAQYTASGEADGQSFHDRYVLEKILGEGAFARVFKAQDARHENVCAAKILSFKDESQKDGNPLENPKALKKVREFHHERRMWKIVGDHPNCLRLYDSSMDNAFGYFVMEFCSGGTLLQCLRNTNGLNEYVLASYFKEMLLGVQHLHSVSIVHRDVKQDNFLLGGPSGTTLKLCDYGLSCLVPAGGWLTGTYGTAPYMSPEMLKDRHSFGLDVWSLGVLVYSQLFGDFPYSPAKKNPQAMKALIKSGDVLPPFRHQKQGPGEEHVSSAAMEFVKSLLNRDPEQRPTVSMALSYKYIKCYKELEVAARAKGPLTCLAPMLHGAIRAGAYVTRCPQENLDLDQALVDLQCKSGSRGAFVNNHQAFASGTSSTSSDKLAHRKGVTHSKSNISNVSTKSNISSKSGGTTITSTTVYSSESTNNTNRI
jgi:serine/threonine protein kinase